MTSAMRFHFSVSLCSLRFPAAASGNNFAFRLFSIHPIHWQSKP